MKRILAACICIGLLVLSGTVQAQQQDRNDMKKLQRTVEKQNELIQELLRRIETLEATQEDQTEWMETSKEEKPLWWEKVKLKGDFRYRYEYIDDERKDEDRNRNRIRARLGVDAEVTPTVDLHFQLSSAEVVEVNKKNEGNPTSGNQTLTNAWSLKHIWISQAYADWHPEPVPGLNVLAGKIKRPFITPVKSELIWDGDVNPEGVAVKYKKTLDSTELLAQAYGFWIIESQAGGDSGLFGGQVAVKQKLNLFEDSAHVMGGLSYYDFGNVEGEAFLVNGKSFGNTTVGSLFAEDFDLFEVFGEFGFKARETPVTLFADYVTNTAASDEDTGWSVGFKIGKAQKPGSWQFKYLYKDVEQDAVFGTFTDSDFGGGSTDVEGHEFALAYQIARNWQVAATLFLNDVDVEKKPEEDYTKLQLDVVFKF